jgi:NADP-dependent 3-hydroxy acid dehydrogenase YdfG
MGQGKTRYGVFRGKIAVITGAASGLGQGFAIEIGKAGGTVIAADINFEGAVQTIASITAAGGKGEAHRLDVRDSAAVTALVDGTVARHGRIDYIFNNAGIAILGLTEEIPIENWDEIVDINLKGVVYGTSAAYRHMVRQGSGHIVNTASLAGLTPAPGEISYAASKHAVVGLSCALRAEAADLGVRVSVVCPGLIDTPIIRTSEVRGIERDAMMKVVGSTKWMSPDACARAILRGVEKNKAIIVITPLARAIWLLTRISPSLAIRFWQKMLLARLRPLRRAAAEAGPTQN